MSKIRGKTDKKLFIYMSILDLSRPAGRAGRVEQGKSIPIMAGTEFGIPHERIVWETKFKLARQPTKNRVLSRKLST